MGRNRIKARPLQFAAWIVVALIIVGSLATFSKGVGYYGTNSQVLCVTGGLLIQRAESSLVSGWQTFDV